MRKKKDRYLEEDTEDINDDCEIVEDDEMSGSDEAEYGTSDDEEDGRYDAEDDEDGEYDTEDDEDMDMSEPEDEETRRRRMRHKRRVRSQAISYVIIGIIVLAIACGIFYLAHVLAGMLSEHKQEQAVEAEIAAIDETPEEDVTIEAPEETVEETQEEEYTETDYLGDLVSTVISEMSVEDKVAQLFMITPEALTGTDGVTQAGDATQTALQTYAVGGLVYSSANMQDADQLTEMLSTTQSMSKYDLFLATYEPGGDTGSVVSSAVADVPATDSPTAVAENGDSTAAYTAGSIVGGYLSQYGFNLDLAPAGDMASVEGSVAAQTSYGSDEATVSDMVVQMISGLDSASVFSCITDFPGNGTITESTADGPVESDLSADAITAQLVPYISATAGGADMVMLSNVKFTAADDSGAPASLSEYIIGTVLRGNMGYDGIVITGPLSEKAITDEYTSQEAALAAIQAGADMIYMPENFEEAYQAVLSAVQDGTIQESRIDESLQRILSVKYADEVE